MIWVAHLVHTLPEMSHSGALGNRRARGALDRGKSCISVLTAGAFLALVSFRLALETGLLCGAECTAPSGSEIMPLKMLLVSRLQASSKSHPNPSLPGSFSEAFPAWRNEAARSQTLRVSDTLVSVHGEEQWG